MTDSQKQKNEGKKVGSVMVVGAGIGGMQASLDLANAGLHVTLVEETTAIGGRMAQLDKTFPTNDCAMCTISPKLIEVDKHLNIDIITAADVIGLEGEAGDFKVKLRKRPRFVDLEKCNNCGDCIEKCPVEVPSEFDEGTMPRKAIYKRYPQAIPGAMAISKAERAPCVLTCPANVNCQGYIALVADGKFDAAYELIRERNPFPSVCGRVCHHPCETECSRQEIDSAVAINNLKRFTSDWVATKRAEGEDACPAERGEIDPSKPRVAVVGGGPAGMTAARDLALLGYPVTLLEAQDKLGGAMWLGVPEYRLPDDVLARDIADVVASGFEIQTGKLLGTDFTLESLKDDGFEAVFLAVGCPCPTPLTQAIDGTDLKGTDLDGVLLGVDFLRDVTLGRGPKFDGKVVVIGGGNVAMDAALTARRQGATEVEIVCLESRTEMPAHEWEIEDAVEEGVILNPQWGIREFAGKNGRVVGVKLQRCDRVFDDEGRFAPSFGSDMSETTADIVIVAIGQRSDFCFLGTDDPLWDESKRRVHTNQVTLQSNVEWVFAGGDMISGPASVIEAVSHGHEAAESIDRFLRGVDLTEGRGDPSPEPAALPEWPHVSRSRAVPARIDAGDRVGYAEIEMTLDEESAVAEAERCLACGICSECLQCVEACTAEAILHDMEPEEVMIEAGAVILTPGVDVFDASLRGEYGYGIYKNVITSLEFERVLSASGPYQGHILRPSDLQEPKRVAWIQCVGSRDVQCGNDYCSGVCCMYAIKEAIMAVDHVPGLEATVFYNDIRAYGKGFEAYYESSKNQFGVNYKRGIISSVKERQQTNNLLLTFVSEDGEIAQEEFDLVVLSVGLRPSGTTPQLAEALGLELDRFGFCQSQALAPGRTTRDGVFVAGAFSAPMDIPETVMTASAAAAMVGEELASARGTRIREKEYPEERDISSEEPRIGVFVCRCGTNIARVVGVPDVVEYAATLPNVVHAEENLYTCSTDTQTKIHETILEYNLNRVVVASCTPRTHEPLFQDTLRDAGLNRHLFEMANIRDQCSWVHFNQPEEATFKAKDLIRMAVARSATLQPLDDILLDVDQRAIVLGAGIAGMTSALSLADQGFEVSLVERESEPGGVAREIMHTLQGDDPRALVRDLVTRIDGHDLVTLYTDAEVEDFSGHIGAFEATLQQGERIVEIGGGAVIVATGGAAYQPTEYGYPDNDRIVTQLELEKMLDEPDVAAGLEEVVMIQCVGSRDDEHPYCSRICCQEAVKNALAIVEANPAARVYVLFRDIRTYGLDEVYYQQAREAGVIFIRFDSEQPPEVTTADGLEVRVIDQTLNRTVLLKPNAVVLSVGVRPHPATQSVSKALKVPVTADGFFLEAHVKLRPLDFGSDGIFLAGLAHAPKTIAESISQAKGAAARAATVISKPTMFRSAVVSEVDSARCAGCLTCVRMCPYDVPVIGEDGVAFIEPASCQGCGICASVCPRKAIVTKHYDDSQLIPSINALFGDSEYETAGASTSGGAS